MNNNTILKTVNGKDVLVSPLAAEFSLHQQSSTYVAYFGTDKAGQRMFFQFTNGTCFVLSGVEAGIQDLATGVESIGKFWHSNLKGKFPIEQVEGNSIIDAGDDDNIFNEDDDEAIFDRNF